MKSDFNFYDESKVYTSAIDLYGIDKFVPYTQLPESFVSWIENTSIELINNSTMAEIKFKSIMSQSNTPIVEQAFFNINGKSYFVDFFLPEYMTIIEIDGNSHIDKQLQDAIRDDKFLSIGIKTIRLTNQDLYRTDFKKHISALISIKGAIERHSDRYYNTPIDNRYNNKLTKNQMLFETCIGKLKNFTSEQRIIIVTDSTYFIKAALNCRYYKPEQKNFGLLMRFLKVLYENKLCICMKYVGKRDKLSKSDTNIIEKLDNCIYTKGDIKIIDLTYNSMPKEMKQTTKMLEKNLDARLNWRTIQKGFNEYIRQCIKINKTRK